MPKFIKLLLILSFVSMIGKSISSFSDKPILLVASISFDSLLLFWFWKGTIHVVNNSEEQLHAIWPQILRWFLFFYLSITVIAIGIAISYLIRFVIDIAYINNNQLAVILINSLGTRYSVMLIILGRLISFPFLFILGKTLKFSRPFFSTIVLICIWMILMFFINFYPMNQKINNESTKIDCSNPEILSSFFKQSFIKANISSTDILVIPASQKNISVMSRRKATEPLIMYPARDWTKIYLTNHPFEEINAIFQNTVNKKFLTDGYAKNELVASRHLYKKDGALYEILLFETEFIENKFIKDGRKATLVNINCGYEDKKLDELYDSLFSSQLIKNELLTKNLTNLIFRISNLYKNGEIVVIGVSNDFTPGGYGLWVYKKGDGWEKIHEGQQEPECSLLENLKIESGIDCINYSTSSQGKTK